MRKSKVFVGSSHPELGNLVCEKLGVQPGKCTLKKFSNGETSIEIGVSVRDEDIYVIQSCSDTINDHIMEMLILISGCKGGSANKITAVMPMFPYSKQSKMKKHRGAITARMLANLLIMAGADHVITMDLHASQMQGFFTKPVDNLYAGPTLGRWIRHNVPDYSNNAVIVSKNPGGTKRVTALADALKVNFAMIHTDRRRGLSSFVRHQSPNSAASGASSLKSPSMMSFSSGSGRSSSSTPKMGLAPGLSLANSSRLRASSSLKNDPFIASDDDEEVVEDGVPIDVEGDGVEEEIVESEVHVARVVQGHVVDDDYPETNVLEIAKSFVHDPDNGLAESVASLGEVPHALGGTVDAAASDDEEEQFETENLITLVGDVRGKDAIILDDLIDRHSSFIAAAEHLRMNCGARKVIVIATHGIFSGDSLELLQACKYVDQIVVTNTYPIAKERREAATKLTVIDISGILAECIRRNHYGESISALFEQLAYV